MKKYRHSEPRGLFRGNELMRLMTMVVMLGVLFLLIARSRDPNTWAWLVKDQKAVEKPSPPPLETRNETPPAPSGPTDLDPEEIDAAKEQFQAITDATEKIQPEEMPVYKRILNWVQNQSLSQMVKRARRDVHFNQFYQTPDKYRGQLFELDLTVYLVRDLEKFDGAELYEVWGPTDESKSWLYDGVVIGLPRDMPVGREIYEKATLVGYFFKLQGYQPAGAKPNAVPLKAPLFIGRLIWHPTEKPQAQNSNWSWGLYLLAGFLIFMTIRWGLVLWAHKRPSTAYPEHRVNTSANPVDEWLAKTDMEGDDPIERDGPNDAV